MIRTRGFDLENYVRGELISDSLVFVNTSSIPHVCMRLAFIKQLSIFY